MYALYGVNINFISYEHNVVISSFYSVIFVCLVPRFEYNILTRKIMPYIDTSLTILIFLTISL